MWTIPKTINNTSFSSLKAFDLSSTNVSAPLFKRNLGLTTSNKPLDLVNNNTKPPITKDDTPLEPVYSGFMFELEGLWESSSLTKASYINKINQDTYFWFNDKTYIFSDTAQRNFIGSVEMEVTDEVNFGLFEKTVTKVLSNGLNLDFTQIDGNLIVIPTSKSCRARLGDVANIYFELVYPDVSTERKAINIFDISTLNISLVTNFIYQNENFYLSNTLDRGTLVNISNSRFLIIR